MLPFVCCLGNVVVKVVPMGELFNQETINFLIFAADCSGTLLQNVGASPQGQHKAKLPAPNMRVNLLAHQPAHWILWEVIASQPFISDKIVLVSRLCVKAYLG
jgi:hypothetical protein